MREIKVLFEQAQVARNNNETEVAVRLYDEVRVKALAEDNQWLGTVSLHQRGVALKQVGRYDEADTCLSESQQEIQVHLAGVLRDRADIALHQKKFSDAVRLLQRSIDYLIDSSQKGHLGMSMVKLGIALASQGKFDEGKKIIQNGIREIEKSADIFFLSNGYFHLGQAQKQNGEKDEARKSLLKSLDVLNSISGSDQFQPRRKQIESELDELVTS